MNNFILKTKQKYNSLGSNQIMAKVIILLLVLNFQIFSLSKEELRKQIEDLLKFVPSSTKVGILIYDPILRDTLFKLNPTQSMIPASNTKLFTTAVALSNLGGDFQISTKIFSDDSEISDGVINGNLYIKGFGNSTFTQYDLDRMVGEIQSKGINKVTGNVVGDDTYFDNVYRRDDWIADEVANVKLPPVSALVLDRNRKVVQIRKGKRIRTQVSEIQNPPLHLAIELRSKLIASGISVDGNAKSGETSGKSFLLTESSINLNELIKLINKHSDNFLAEVLFKTIGAEKSKVQGTAFYSTQAILDFIEDNGIYANGTTVVDGSGISRYDQITPAAIVGILEAMYFDVNNFSDFYNSLAIAGVDGTLRRRMTGSIAENNFRGKTGSLNGVTSLAGYLKTKNSDDIIVSMIFEYQKGSSSFYKDLEDEIITLVCSLD